MSVSIYPTYLTNDNDILNTYCLLVFDYAICDVASTRLLVDYLTRLCNSLVVAIRIYSAVACVGTSPI